MEVVNNHNMLKDRSFRRSQKSNIVDTENGQSVEYFGNMLIRRQYYGSMETLPEDDPNSALSRKMSRFRVEPSDDGSQLIARSPSLAKLENPEFQTRWYFKFFLGTVHNNYAFTDGNKEPHALSICLTDAENHGIPQYRAILWQKSGCRRICFPYVANKAFTSREVLSYFGMEKIEKNPREIIAPEVQKELLVLEEQEGSVNFKFGVIYAQKGQATDDEMFGNVSGSREFIQFLNVLGDTIDLKGWTGYRGGLDVKDNMTGINSVYTMFEGHEVMFHVSVMLPYSTDTQQVERKRHIGNDIAVIVFVDGEPEEELAFKPSSIRTKFTHVFAVIRYSTQTKSYWLSVFSEENVPAYGPPIPVPARFMNPQEFRSFLITKLMNGEKAAYVSPVFSNKRQRTLESLISGLQNDQWLKPEKFGFKRAVSHAVTNREHKRAFLELGQTLKVNKIMQGVAPTSVNNVGGLLALKNTPWEPHAVLSNFARPIICGDSFGNSLLVSCDLGIYLVTESGARHVFDRSMTANQLNVLEDYGLFVVRIRKNGRIYVIPLSDVENERQNVLCRRHCTRYYLKKSKGSHLYAVSRQESPYVTMAFAVGKRLTIYSWDPKVRLDVFGDRNSVQPLVNFRRQSDFMVAETPLTLTIVHNNHDKLMLCVGLRHRFDVINVDTKQVSLLKNIVTYRKPKIVSALDIFDDENPELLLTYSHTSVFVRLSDNIAEIVSFYWNNAPKDIVCAFPYILGFSENSIEIRLMVNGNLVHTHCVPHMKLITAKGDIYFTSNVHTATPSTLRRRRSNAGMTSQSFMKIGLSDLAGLNALAEPEEFVDNMNEIMSRRNIGVSDNHYTSNRNLNELNKLKGSTAIEGDALNHRTYSASAAFCSPIINVHHDVIDITTIYDTVDVGQGSKSEEEKPPPSHPENKTTKSVGETTTNTTVTMANVPKQKPAVAPKPKSIKKGPLLQHSVSSATNTSDKLVKRTVENIHRSNEKIRSTENLKQTPVNEQKSTNNCIRFNSPSTTNKKMNISSNGDMFYAPQTTSSATLPAMNARKQNLTNHRKSTHLEQIGARHLNNRNSSSLQALTRTFSHPSNLDCNKKPSLTSRCNSSTVTTRFDGNVWDISLTQQPKLSGKWTQV